MGFSWKITADNMFDPRVDAPEDSIQGQTGGQDGTPGPLVKVCAFEQSTPDEPMYLVGLRLSDWADSALLQTAIDDVAEVLAREAGGSVHSWRFTLTAPVVLLPR